MAKKTTTGNHPWPSHSAGWPLMVRRVPAAGPVALPLPLPPRRFTVSTFKAKRPPMRRCRRFGKELIKREAA